MSQTQHILAFDALRLYLSPAGNALSLDAPSTCATRNLYSSDTITPNYLHKIFNYVILTIYYILFNHIGIFIIIGGIRNNIFSLRSFIANPCQSP